MSTVGRRNKETCSAWYFADYGNTGGFYCTAFYNMGKFCFDSSSYGIVFSGA